MQPRRVFDYLLRGRIRFMFTAVVLCWPAGALWAQPFLLQVQQGNSFTVVSNGATITVAAGGTANTGSVTITATYQGSSTAVVSSAVLSVPRALRLPEADCRRLWPRGIR